MYPIVGTIGYILPLCGEGKTTAKKNLEKRKNKRKTQQKLKKRKNTAKKKF